MRLWRFAMLALLPVMLLLVLATQEAKQSVTAGDAKMAAYWGEVAGFLLGCFVSVVLAGLVSAVRDSNERLSHEDRPETPGGGDGDGDEVSWCECGGPDRCDISVACPRCGRERIPF